MEGLIFRGSSAPPVQGEVVIVYPQKGHGGEVFSLVRRGGQVMVALYAGDCSPSWEEHGRGISWRDVRVRKEEAIARLLTQEFGEEVLPASAE